jgi:hypothetical protein
MRLMSKTYKDVELLNTSYAPLMKNEMPILQLYEARTLLPTEAQAQKSAGTIFFV